MDRKKKISLKGQGSNIFFSDSISDKTTNQQNDLSINQLNNKSTYRQRSYKRVTFYIPPDIHQRIKIEAAKKNIKISEYVNEILNVFFTEDKS